MVRNTYPGGTMRIATVTVLATLTLTALLPPPAATAHARATTYHGDSDDIVKVKTTTKTGLAKITYSGDGYFSVWGLKPNGDEGQLLASAAEAYTGTVAYNTSTWDKLAGLKVTADASWTIQLLPLTKAKYWAINSKGTGDQVLRLTRTSHGFHTLKIRYTGDGYFSVWALNAAGKEFDLLASAAKTYKGTVRLPSGTRYASIHADAPWTMVRK
jgi:hypothetical protein